MNAITASLHSNLRPLALALLLLVEVMIVSLGFDAFDEALLESGAWFAFLSHAGQFARVAVAVLVFTLLGLWPRAPLHLEAMNRSVAGGYRYQYRLGAQLVAFAVFVWCTAAVFGEQTRAEDMSSLLPVAWIAALVATSGLWLLALAPGSFWRRFAAAEAGVLLAAAAVGLLAWVLARYAQTLWSPMSELTFRLAGGLLELFYTDIIADPETKRLGVQGFSVLIAPVCSGYEGMGLMAIFTAFYLSVFRADFRFPQALLLFPIGLGVIWTFNVVRIAALIAIGASISPQVAVGGFHSQAGWISFIAVIMLTLTLAYRLPFFNRIAATGSVGNPTMTLPMALLIPFIVLLASTIVSSALSADFDWFYPLRVVAVGLALLFCWRRFGLSRPAARFEPWLAGVAVFGLWILLVPVDPAADQGFDAQLFAASPAIIALWLLFRIVGAVITVPLAEELLFRGYLLSRLAGREPLLQGRLEFSWMPLLVSSALFGLLHGDWVAGIGAGLVFGWVRYRGDVRDAIIAHACTNGLLTAYVIAGGHWSLW